MSQNVATNKRGAKGKKGVMIVVTVAVALVNEPYLHQPVDCLLNKGLGDSGGGGGG
jgi:hypothetical protein